MSSRTRAAAVLFLAAVETHLRSVEESSGETDTEVRAAFAQLSEAFAAYEDALYDEHDEVLPFEIVEFDDEDDGDSDDDDDDDDDDIEWVAGDGGVTSKADS